MNSIKREGAMTPEELTQPITLRNGDVLTLPDVTFHKDGRVSISGEVTLQLAEPVSRGELEANLREGETLQIGKYARLVATAVDGAIVLEFKDLTEQRP